MLFSVTDRMNREGKSFKDIEDLKNIINQFDITDIYRVLHWTKAKYIFFSIVHETATKLDHILGQKTTLINFLKFKPCKVCSLTTVESSKSQ